MPTHTSNDVLIESEHYMGLTETSPIQMESEHACVREEICLAAWSGTSSTRTQASLSLYSIAAEKSIIPATQPLKDQALASILQVRTAPPPLSILMITGNSSVSDVETEITADNYFSRVACSPVSFYNTV